MRVPLDPSSRAPNRGKRVSLSVGPVYERVRGHVVRAGVLAIADGLVAPSPFWELLQKLALRAEWLRATFALASRPACYGVVQADGGGAPLVGFCGTWQSTPRLTLIVAGKNIASEETLESELAACFSTASVRRDDDPFPRWQPGDPWLPVCWERAC
jgi:hypothetical protein